jgi:uncharacterized protein (TIGR02217 family)
MSTANFMEILFPTNVSLGAIGGTGWSTRVVVTDSGDEYRQQLWGYSRGKWTVGHNLRTPAEIGVLLSFHRLMMGKTYGFRFQDWTDYQDGGNGVISENASSVWQLTKLYSLQDLFGNTFNNYRLISKPVPGSVAFSLNGSPHVLGGTLDYTTGQITFGDDDPAPGPDDIYTWTGQFHVPVRFDTDTPEVSQDLPLTGAGWKGIPVIETRIKGQ